MMLLASKIIWCIGVMAWFIIRYPHSRRSRRNIRVRVSNRNLERVLLSIASCGLGFVPALYVFANLFPFADYALQVWQPWVGAATFALSLWMFYQTHANLGRNWSVTLVVREKHALVTEGIYKHVRHPMYSAFWLWAGAQALLLPNWIAGFSGAVGFGTLYFFRVRREEAMMTETFGDDYRAYMKRTGRIIPRISLAGLWRAL
jgi:protein-S-isoprenylcysteine O-methyltransferase Ste14